MTPEPTTSTRDVAAPAADQPTRELYHMSRTAGVGLGDYAAVNVRAVIGLLLGAASVLALIFADSYLPLLIPLAALVVSGIALVQIQRSNGTQTGKGVAIAGLLLGLLLGGATLSKQIGVVRREKDASAQIAEVVKRFSDANVARDARSAYAQFASAFQQQVQPESFERTMVSRLEALKIQRFELGPRVVFESTTAGSLARAAGLVVLHSAEKDPQGNPLTTSIPAEFVIENGQWKIGDVRDYFIQQQPQAPGQAQPQMQ